VKRGPGVAELCERLGVPEAARRKLELLLDLVADDQSAPTSVTDPEEALEVHVADSLSLLPHIASLLAARPDVPAIVDMGSGAGFPGLPLAVALDGATVDLVEARERKCRFISRAIERLEQPNARVVCMRVEDWARAEGAGRYRLAVVRAVAPLATLVEYASPLLADGGSLVCWKGSRDEVEERRGAAAAQAVGLMVGEVRPVTPFPGSRQRHLHFFAKVEQTPPGFPRRTGMARKRPLGGK
jgi:16S rRNA (guanine527-N7)-methyltransferase